ncbi:MAG: precorrin-2 dehydrogenase/sirohydrochlorin ferrochelatase family protein [Ilumatobacteraceae bacterium]
MAGRFDYPVVLDLVDVPVLVVGAGPVAVRKVDGLAAAGATVRVVAPEVAPELDLQHVVDLRRREYQRDDLDGVRLVVTATGRRDVDAAVAADAKAAGLWVNAADQPEDCSFILPAIARNGPLSVAVSTGGASPALARRLRDRAAELLTDDVVALAHELAQRRRQVRDDGGSTEDVDWAPLIDPVVPPIKSTSTSHGALTSGSQIDHSSPRASAP